MSNLITALILLFGLLLLANLLWSVFTRATLDHNNETKEGTVPVAHFTFQMKESDSARAEAEKLKYKLLKQGVIPITKETRDPYGGGTVFVSVNEGDLMKAKQLI